MSGYRYRAIVDTVPSSESLAALSDFEERLLWRLVSQTDDFGVFHATPAKVRAECVPLLPVTDPVVAVAIEAIVREGHAELYFVGGRAYLHFIHFDEYQPRAFIRGRDLKGRRRFPEKPLQTHGHAHEVEVEVEVEEALRAPRGRAGEDPVVEPAEEPAQAKSPAESPAKRPPDELWDALATLLEEPATRSERGRRNRAVKELREIDATAEDVLRRAANYRRRWPTLALTASALVSNWTLLGTPVPASRGGVSAREIFEQAGVTYRP